MQKEKFSKKKKSVIIIVILCVVLLSSFIFVSIKSKMNQTEDLKEKTEQNIEQENQEDEIQGEILEYQMSGNALEDFDLSFLKLENKKDNIIYSPLSIKYALEMLSEGTNGKTKEQIDKVIGEYKRKSYNNSDHMSFANALFVNKSLKEGLKEEYKTNLINKYHAELILDAFKTPNTINRWIENKTLGIIDHLLDENEDISSHLFFLVNALAINMEWENQIQRTMLNPRTKYEWYSVYYPHEKYFESVTPLDDERSYSSLPFNDKAMNAKAVEIGASINRYDIINELGEKNIRDTITKEYTEWLANPPCDYGSNPTPVSKFVNQFVSELGESYQKLQASTDFMFYKDDSVKVFAKDLKEYDGTTLQYVGIMPISKDINTYIQEMNAESLTQILYQLKSVELENFTPRTITKITGFIPLFQFEYELQLMKDLKKMGIQDVFNQKKADLSLMTSIKEMYIERMLHKTNIEFSNEGIKAASVTEGGGGGAGGCRFEHLYEVPVETIDLTFDKPYLFLIRDKNTQEIWFVGKVQKPLEKS